MTEGWICEEQSPGVRLCLEVEEPLLHLRTTCQDLALTRTRAFGRLLALDGRYMVTERDWPFYHEMLVHPALLSHARPERVLVVGGGDGGAARLALEHPSVSTVTLVEIDPGVISVARAHLASVHGGALDDPRLQVVIAPAEEFVPARTREFDAILVDSTDPVGPGEALFRRAFWTGCAAALRPGGILSLQAGDPFYHPEVLAGAMAGLREVFPVVIPHLGFVPSYPSGLWAYVLAGDRSLDVKESVLEKRFHSRRLTTRYYTPQLHRAAAVLPRFVDEIVRSEEAR
ncbi:MAG: Spermidine synthase [Candidatus Bipolaricaulis sibiricus]|uniref:Polyamine aminopropyltransferase n=1 Tax=Bipolaricaulis sibiricus TaxID=2501609 RepID=A0A410FUV5_BIPS1|nr:MAG: Spermidine synthase [Candidatus Bipolaricaulis sibiricus]